MIRTELAEFAFFIVFCIVCWAAPALVSALHLTNGVVNGIAVLVAFGIGIAAIEWWKNRVMGKARSRYVAPVIFWDTLVTPALLFAYYLVKKSELAIDLAIALYLGVGILVLAIVALIAIARRRSRTTTTPQ
jgi:hypothetical protein